jgi:hypothetical protein
LRIFETPEVLKAEARVPPVDAVPVIVTFVGSRSHELAVTVTFCIPNNWPEVSSWFATKFELLIATNDARAPDSKLVRPIVIVPLGAIKFEALIWI